MVELVHINSSAWEVVLQPGIIHISDAPNIIMPTSIAGVADVGPAPGSRVFTRNTGGGKHLAVQLVYPNNLVVSVDPSVRLFGRHNRGERWRAVTSIFNKQDVELATNNDTDDTVFLRTVFDNKKHVWPLFGYQFYAFGVVVPLDGTVGNKTLAFLEAKIIDEFD